MKKENRIHLKQKLAMTTRMQQAINILKLPADELDQWVDEQILQNPLLKLDATHFHQSDCYLETASRNETLQDFLQKEFILLFQDPEERHIANAVSNALDEKGFLSCSYKDIADSYHSEESKVKAIAEKISQLEPAGLATLDVMHSLLAQLKKQNKEDSAAYAIIQNHWKDLIHNRKLKICKALHLSSDQLNSIIQKDIRSLNPYPASIFETVSPLPVKADLTIYEQDNVLCLSIRSKVLSDLSMDQDYLDKACDQKFIRECLSHAQWLKDVVAYRSKTIEKIGLYILHSQKAFFTGHKDTPEPIRTADLAEELEVSISTVCRAIQHKYIDTPRGFFPLAYFTSTTKLQTIQHTDQIHQAIFSAIKSEDKTRPLSDQQIVALLKSQGIPISRRTVAKYRNQLKIPSLFSRKNP